MVAAAEGSDAPGDAVDVVAAGGPADYLGTTYRGLVGLRLACSERWPDRRWYGSSAMTIMSIGRRLSGVWTALTGRARRSAPAR